MITKDEIRQIIKEEIEKALLIYAESEITNTAMKNDVYFETIQPS